MIARARAQAAALARALGKTITHRLDEHEDLQAAMREYQAQGAAEPDADELPPEVEQEIVGKYLARHYQRWLDEKIPALDDRTPRQTAKTREGRLRVARLLTEIEEGSEGQPGIQTVDFAAMRAELGLARIAEDVDLIYDPDEPPPPDWAELDEMEQHAIVEAAHEPLPAWHPPLPNPRLHAILHCIVENQLLSDEMPEPRAALERLLAAGATRHEAIHAVGAVVTEEIHRVMTEETPYDREGVARKLRALGRDSGEAES